MGMGFLHGKKGGGIDTSDANAVAGDILVTKSAYVNDEKVDGSMPNRAGDTACLASSVSGTTLKLRASDGYRDGSDDNVTITDADFIAANIKNAVNIFGLAGNYDPNLAGSLSIAGTYASATYYTAANCYLTSDPANGIVVLVMRSGTSTGYEHIIFSEVSTPAGVTMLADSDSSPGSTSDAAQSYFCCVFTGVTGKLNVSVNLSAVNSTYDTVTASITAAYA